VSWMFSFVLFPFFFILFLILFMFLVEEYEILLFCQMKSLARNLLCLQVPI